MNNYYAQLSVDELTADPAVKAYVLEANLAPVWEAWLEEHPEQAVKMMKVQRLLRQSPVEEPVAKVIPPVAIEPVHVASETAPVVTEVVSTQDVSDAVIVAPKHEARGIRGMVQRKQWGRVAVLAAVALGALYYLYTLQLGGDLYRTEAGEERVVTLADGSTVYMAPMTTLRVKDAGEARLLNLLGEAFFEVTPGTPLTVSTSVGVVTATNASFAVEADKGLAVSCASGEVNVTHNEASVLLAAGYGVRSTPDGLAQPFAIPVASIAPWRGGRLVIKDLSVSEALKSFKRYYPRGFKVDRGLLKKRVTLELPTHDFSLAIERVNFALGVEVDTVQGIIR